MTTITRILEVPGERSIALESTDDGMYILHIEAADEAVDQAGVMDFPLTDVEFGRLVKELQMVRDYPEIYR